MKPTLIDTGRLSFRFSTMVSDAKAKQRARRAAVKLCPWWKGIVGVLAGFLVFIALYAFVMWESDLIHALALREPWERFFIALFTAIFAFGGWVLVVASHENRGES